MPLRFLLFFPETGQKNDDALLLNLGTKGLPMVFNKDNPVYEVRAFTGTMGEYPSTKIAQDSSFLKHEDKSATRINIIRSTTRIFCPFDPL